MEDSKLLGGEIILLSLKISHVYELGGCSYLKNAQTYGLGVKKWACRGEKGWAHM